MRRHGVKGKEKNCNAKTQKVNERGEKKNNEEIKQMTDERK